MPNPVLRRQRRYGRHLVEFLCGDDIEKLYSVVDVIARLVRLPSHDLATLADGAIRKLNWPRLPIDSAENRVRQLRAIFRGALETAQQKIADCDPLPTILHEIQVEQQAKQAEKLRQRRQSDREVFRARYGRKCVGCGKNTEAVHPILDVLCCRTCRSGRDELKMIYKSTAKTEFALTEADCDSLMSASTANPHYRSGPPAVLFLRVDVIKAFEEKSAAEQEACKQRIERTVVKRKKKDEDDARVWRMTR